MMKDDSLQDGSNLRDEGSGPSPPELRGEAEVSSARNAGIPAQADVPEPGPVGGAGANEPGRSDGRPAARQRGPGAAEAPLTAAVPPNVQTRPGSHRRRSLSSLKRKLNRAVATIRHQRIAMIVFSCIGVAVLLVSVSISISADRRLRDAESVLIRNDITIEKLRATVDEQRSSIDTLVGKRLPGLVDLEFDRMFTVDHPYVRNIAFTNVRSQDGDAYEFRIVLENQIDPIAYPSIDIILFDNVGIEIARRSLRGSSGVNTLVIESLNRGNVHSYVGSFIVRPDAAPVYFRVR